MSSVLKGLLVALGVVPMIGWSFMVSDPITHEALKSSFSAPLHPAPTSDSSGNLVQNGFFNEGLNEWTALNDVEVIAAEAVLGDLMPLSALLYQVIPTVPGEYTLSFDFSPSLSDSVPVGFAPDTFFASLYFFNDAGIFDLTGGSFDDAIGLLDVDSAGMFNVVGNVGPSDDKGPGWFHFSYAFLQPYTYVAVAFELAGLNSIMGDSSVWVDNVVLIPEPSTLGLMIFAGTMLIVRRYRRGVL